MLWHSLGQNGHASADYDAAIRSNPKLIDAYRYRATARKAMGELDHALTDVEAVLTHEPTDKDAWAVRAAIFQSQGKYDESVADFSRLIEADTRRFGFALLERATIRLKTGKPDQAVEDFSQALRLAPWFSLSHLGRARAWIVLGQEDKALADLDEVQWSRSIPAQRSDSWYQLEDVYGELLNRFPKSATAYLARGRLRAQRLDEDDWQKTLERHPGRLFQMH